MKDKGTEVGKTNTPPPPGHKTKTKQNKTPKNATLRVEERGRMKRILGSTVHGEANGNKSRAEKAPEKPRKDKTYKENYSL